MNECWPLSRLSESDVSRMRDKDQPAFPWCAETVDQVGRCSADWQDALDYNISQQEVLNQIS